MQPQFAEWTRTNIQADIEHLRSVIGRIDCSVSGYPSTDDMRLRRALRWAMARKKRILDRLEVAA